MTSYNQWMWKFYETLLDCITPKVGEKTRRMKRGLRGWRRGMEDVGGIQKERNVKGGEER